MEDRLSIGILCHPTYGGSGVVASELALSLADRGHAVHLFSHQVPPRLAQSEGPVQMHVSQGLPYPLFASTPHDLAVTSSVLRVHRDEGLDILHAHYALPHAVSAILARAAAEGDSARPAPRVVTTLHGTDITIVGSDPSYAPLTQYLLSASDAATAVSHSLAGDTRRHFCPGATPCSIEVIHNFVDTERFSPQAAGAQRAKKRAPRAVHVSNFRPVKRVPWLVEAFERATKGAQAELVLVGDGPTRAEACETARRLGLGSRVRFLGERDALPELLAPADVFLLASSEESFGLSALEALSCGVPVVATAVGGVPEVIRDGETGLLSPPDDLERYSVRIRELLLDPARARAMGAAARSDVLARFARDPIVAQYEDLYRRVLARARSASLQA
jgi:N-acetyl-alpha-D-glucosaminyl L-malate synthase BshA